MHIADEFFREDSWVIPHGKLNGQRREVVIDDNVYVEQEVGKAGAAIFKAAHFVNYARPFQTS